MNQSNLDYRLVYAAHRGDHDGVLKSLRAGARTSTWDERALREAALSGHKDTVQLLCQHGADVGNALSWAAKTGNLVTAARLVEYAPAGNPVVITLRAAFAHVGSFEAAVAAGIIREAPPPSKPYLAVSGVAPQRPK